MRNHSRLASASPSASRTTAFATLYGEHAEHCCRRFNEYSEAASQLILQACLQRIVNGGGRIEREYGLGRGRTDLLVLWPGEAVQPYDLWRRSGASPNLISPPLCATHRGRLEPLVSPAKL